MRKILLATILLLSTVSYAFHVEGVGNRTFIDNDGDTLYIFESNPEFKSHIGTIDWYRLPDTIAPFSSGTDYLYPEHGQGYAIKVNGQWEYFWTFEYDSLCPQVNGVEVQQSCTQTSLLIDGIIPAIQYVDRQGKLQTITRQCRVTYLDAMWGENDWVDSLVVVEKEYTTSIALEASPVVTNYVITDLLALELNLNDSIVTDMVQPLAIKTHPQAIVTARPGKDAQGPTGNEVDRPIDPDNLIRRSAPLDVEFLANALNADYYQWNLYKGSELFLRRSEAQHRYTFTEPGNYRVVLYASNSYECAIDSVEFDVSVSESMLTVPNTFTPNGDGANDEFRVIYRSIKEFHIWVYNRWGKLVYKSNDPSKGWDGNINGRPASVGAYYYVIRALGTDAESDYMSKPSYSKKLKKQELPIGVYQLSGDINLLR
jgi:gliding motility-associated-like protein